MLTAHPYLRRFIHEHDDMPAFHAAYIVLTLLAALLLNLGCFLLLIIAHASLDIVKYRERFGFDWKGTIEGVVREGLVDMTLFFVGLTLSLYLHHHVGIIGVGSLLSRESQVLRTFALALPKFEIMKHFLGVLLHMKQYLNAVHEGHGAPWSGGECFCFALSGLCAFLIAFSPVLMHLAPGTAVEILSTELIPWRL